MRRQTPYIALVGAAALAACGQPANQADTPSPEGVPAASPAASAPAPAALPTVDLDAARAVA